MKVMYRLYIYEKFTYDKFVGDYIPVKTGEKLVIGKIEQFVSINGIVHAILIEGNKLTNIPIDELTIIEDQ